MFFSYILEFFLEIQKIKCWKRVFVHNKFDSNNDASNKYENERIFLNLLEFTLNLLEFTWICRLEKKHLTDWQTDGRTDKASYRDAWTHLKIQNFHLTSSIQTTMRPINSWIFLHFTEFSWIFLNFNKKCISMSSLMFPWCFPEVSLSFLVVITFFVNGLCTDGPTDRRTNGRTHGRSLL